LGSRACSIGPSITPPIFQGGRHRANLKRSQAVFEENTANYRQRILVAFKEVPDALTGARLLNLQAEAPDRSFASARKTADISNTRYRAG
jgi:outer membrane protein, multidrug efflux system